MEIAVPAADIVRARIDPELKKKATAVLSGMGLSVSDAIRMMLVRVATEEALPFEDRLPNKETAAAMRAARNGEVERFDSVEALLADLRDEDDEAGARRFPSASNPDGAPTLRPSSRA